MAKHTDRGLRRGEGYITERIAKDQTVSYQARWHDGTKWRAKTFRDPDPQTAKEQAEDHVRQVAREIRTGRYIPPSELTVEDVVTQYLARGEARWEPNTYATYVQRSQACIFHQVGGIQVRDLTTPRVQHWVDQLHQEGRSPKTIAGAATILSGAMVEATRLGIIQRSPVTGVKLPRIVRPRHTIWTGEQVALVLAAVAGDPMWHALYRLALMSGMRPGELRALKWSDLELDRSDRYGATDAVLTVYRTMTKDRYGRPTLGSNTKTDETRMIALPGSCALVLKRWATEQRIVRLAADGWEDCGAVFTGQKGRHLALSTWQHYHARLCKRITASLPEGESLPVITLHELRHTNATIELTAGTHPKIISDRLGHKKIETTLNLYSHGSPELQRAAANALEARLDQVTLDATTSASTISKKP